MAAVNEETLLVFWWKFPVECAGELLL